MENKTLGKSTVKVSPVIFGAWAIGGWMWGGADETDAIMAIEKAIDMGVTTIDTAPVYGFGRSEEIVSKAIKVPRDKVQILTKCGLRWDIAKGEFFFDSHDDKGHPLKIYKYSGRDSIIHECEQSLLRLKTDYIDLLQIHWHDKTTPIDEAMEAFERLKSAGKILEGGVSNYSAQQVGEATKTFPIVSNQVPYSMINRGIEKDLLPYCIKNKIGVLAYSPLQRGILAGKIKHGHEFNEGDHRASTSFYKEPNFSRILRFVDLLQQMANEKNISVSQLVLKWTLLQPGISAVLAGARNPAQVAENAMATQVKLDPRELAVIEQELTSLRLE